MNWNNRTYNTPWNNPGGDWFDRNNAAQGNVPYASLTFDAGALPDNRYYDLEVTELVQGYVNGTYSNTGFFLKAKDENDNYIAFYSSDHTNPDQRPKLVINYTTGGTYSLYDVNQDGSVNQTDLDMIGAHFNEIIPTYPRADVNANGVVDIFDVTLVSSHINQ